VVTVVDQDRDSPNYKPLQENLERLRAMKIDGKPLEIFELPTPRRMTREDLVLPASYANFYIANTCVLLPTFADPMDELARATLQKLFPDRKVIGIDCRELIWGLGAFHCLTQQQPRVRAGLAEKKTPNRVKGFASRGETLNWERRALGSARVSRAGDRVTPSLTSLNAERRQTCRF
jgi:hypothetical protein